ncbi:hypothetical protein [Dyadobacter sp. LHD-138]|uniref:hypothetical protein n=1 Tax=Dyadobacter sp. LHD-138 TaxID=3071413 RepID=UPI0027E114BD|nr:hypothetical protein [Dyadobacter sp. LHD-138]MDQ6478301.1 hypothetical protein [Dyadobacter sp. LHD-138]
MKKYIILLLSVTNTMAFAQSRIVCKSVQDDNNALSVHISGTVDGQNIDINHKFDLSMIDRSLRFAFKEKIIDSLDIYIPDGLEQPEQPAKPKAPKAVKPRKPLTTKPDIDPIENVDTVGEDSDVVSSSNDYKTQPTYGKQPFNKEIRYSSDCGELFMRYKYVKDGEEYEYERTVNAKGKSEKERLRIIEETERELGLSLIQ